MSQNETTAPVAALLTQVATPESLAAVCALYKIKATALPSPIGAYLVLDSADQAQTEYVAQNITKTVNEAPAILIVSSEGQMKASQWAAGENVGRLSPAIVLDGAPHELEDLLLGQREARSVEGAVNTGKISRFKAMRILAANAKAYNAKAEK